VNKIEYRYYLGRELIFNVFKLPGESVEWIEMDNYDVIAMEFLESKRLYEIYLRKRDKLSPCRVCGRSG